MPELPEVETVCRGLKQTILGCTIEDIIIRRHDLRIPIPEDFIEQFTHQKIESITRRGKYILMHCSGKHTAIIHLGMSGRLIVHTTPPELQRHDHVILTLSDNYHIVFNDPRRFGLVTYTTTASVSDHPLLTSLGVEPLTDAFDGTYLHQQLRKKSSAIKTSIMDSHLVVGVGNIYAAESLFRARISPTKPSHKLTLKECKLFVQQIKEVLQDAIASGGSTLRDYVRSSGDAGYFQHRFLVYNRENQPCFHCQNPIQKIKQTGRSTFYCTQCQK